MNFPVSLLRGVVVAGIAAMFAAGSAQAAKTVRANAGVGPKHPMNAVSLPAMFKHVEEKTNGGLTFKHYTGGALLTLKATMNGLRDGIADLGVIVYSYHRGELRATQILADLSNLGKDTAVMAGVSTEFFLLKCPQCVAERHAQGIVSLAGYTSAPYVVISKRKITTLDDVKGRKIRTGGGSFGLWGQHVGATEVNIPVNEMFDAFSAGVIDAGVQTIGGLRSYGFWDPAKHVTDLKLGSFSAATLAAVGRDFWKGLTTEERAALLEGSMVAMAAHVEAYDEDVRSILGPAKEKGVEIHAPGADLQKATDEFDASSVGRAKKLAVEQHKVEGGEQLVDEFVALVDKWNKLIKPVRNDYAAIQALLKREIYDKIDPATWGM